MNHITERHALNPSADPSPRDMGRAGHALHNSRGPLVFVAITGTHSSEQFSGRCTLEMDGLFRSSPHVCGLCSNPALPRHLSHPARPLALRPSPGVWATPSRGPEANLSPASSWLLIAWPRSRSLETKTPLIRRPVTRPTGAPRADACSQERKPHSCHGRPCGPCSAVLRPRPHSRAGAATPTGLGGCSQDPRLPCPEVHGISAPRCSFLSQEPLSPLATYTPGSGSGPRWDGTRHQCPQLPSEPCLSSAVASPGSSPSVRAGRAGSTPRRALIRGPSEGMTHTHSSPLGLALLQPGCSLPCPLLSPRLDLTGAAPRRRGLEGEAPLPFLTEPTPQEASGPLLPLRGLSAGAAQAEHCLPDPGSQGFPPSPPGQPLSGQLISPYVKLEPPAPHSGQTFQDSRLHRQSEFAGTSQNNSCLP